MTITIHDGQNKTSYEEGPDGGVLKSVESGGEFVKYRRPIAAYMLMFEIGQAAGAIAKIARREEPDDDEID